MKNCEESNLQFVSFQLLLVLEVHHCHAAEGELEKGFLGGLVDLGTEV